MALPRIQHVSIPRPPGSAATARAFYGTLLGLAEAPVPSSLHDHDLIWFQLGDTELHLFVDQAGEAGGRHFCIALAALEPLRTHLAAAGYTLWDGPPIHNRPRFFCHDPFGNTIEFTCILGDYQER